MTSKVSLITVFPTTHYNTLETERSKKSREVSCYATQTTTTTATRKNCLFFNNYPENDMRYKKVLPGNTFYSSIAQ